MQKLSVINTDTVHITFVTRLLKINELFKIKDLNSHRIRKK